MIDQAVPRFHAAVDLGASSGRVMLGRWADGRLSLIEVHRFPNGPITQDGRLRWDAERLFEETLVGLAEAVRIAEAAGGVLDGIGIDSWGVDIALVGVGTGTAFPSGLASRFPTVPHHRGADADGPARAAVLVDAATAYAVTGVLEQTINTSYQLRSRAEELDVRRADGGRPTVLLVPDLWVWLLTGVVGAERTIASTTQLLDQGTGDWAAELIRRWGLDGFDFPPVVAPGTVAGPTTPEVTARLGSSVPIPVHRVAEHDTASALAFARPHGAELLVSSGSWSLVGVCLPAAVLTEHARAAGFTNEAGVAGSSLLLRNLAGMWLLTECARAWSAEDGSAVDLVDLVAAVSEMEGDAATDVTPAVFDVADPRLLVPGDMPERIATLCRETGQRPPGGRSDVVRTVVESLAVAYAETVRACEAITGVTIRSVRIVGGGSRNRLLCARTAARTGLPVTAGPAEASALGNLAVQLVAAGHAPSLDTVYRHGQDDHDDHDHERTPT
ncbi:rhamnulokinase [Plantibacter flavus]|uniref:Rhamnulokinase n=1 Tax=Plantibacter flavus TaxID=150123 RepID=A0A3N2C4U3_9MICO|nr:FGGY-family carbohydrate kinase [Plantibacter flavus]ROR82541.1 rhamnulokinase [Plantibacter flavus]SMG37961.1 rhamnulokinase [Plantibacter flavus]